jgi:hypothetical protein
MLHSLFSVFGQTYYTYDTPSSTGSTGSAVGTLVMVFAGLAIAAIIITGMWRVFTKAGQKGWAALIPIYNTYILLKIVNRPAWWLLVMLFIPIADLLLAIIVMHDLAKAFGKGAGMTIALVLVPFVALPVLGFGKAEYTGPSAPAAPASPAGTPPASI